MSSASPKLLLVANTSDVVVVFKALEEAGLAQPALGMGGDETIELFERFQPDVVLLVAGVEHGDLAALASAIRSGAYGRPASIVLIADEDGRVQGPNDAPEISFDQFVTRPLTGKGLGDAIARSSRDATGARIHAAMELAIESFVADAMDGLASAANRAPHAAVSAALAPPHESFAVPDRPDPTAEHQPKHRDPTMVLALQDDGSSASQADLDSHSDYALDMASRDLLDRVLPGETLDVDIEELDGVSESRPHYRDDPDGDGGDFARQLRHKMSAMAERLFPGQSSGEVSAAALAPRNAAHTEIDLHEIVEGPVEGTTHAGSVSLGVATHFVDESGITVARASGTASSADSVVAMAGDIDAYSNDIASILGRLWRVGFSGRLELRHDGEEKRIEFDKGNIIFASSRSADDRMGALLLREGKISQEQLADCRQQVSSSGRRMGEVLVDLGYLKPRELLPAVRQHLEDILYSIFAWTSGSFEASAEQAIEERIRLSRHPAALLVEGIRRKYDEPRLATCFGDKDTVVRVHSSETLSTAIGATELSAAENKALGFFDGMRTVEEIADACDLDCLRVAQLAHAWVCLGVGERVKEEGEETSDRLGRKAFSVGETDLEIDRKRVLAKHELVQEGDYFQLLGVRADASGFEIRRAYEAAQRCFNVESFPLELQGELRLPLQEIISVIDEAYLVLSDDHVRDSYRANLH